MYQKWTWTSSKKWCCYIINYVHFTTNYGFCSLWFLLYRFEFDFRYWETGLKVYARRLNFSVLFRCIRFNVDLQILPKNKRANTKYLSIVVHLWHPTCLFQVLFWYKAHKPQINISLCIHFPGFLTIFHLYIYKEIYLELCQWIISNISYSMSSVLKLLSYFNIYLSSCQTGGWR